MYRTIVRFEDLQDNRHEYNPGDIFPRDGLKITNERIKELECGTNRRGIPLIEYVEDKPKETQAEPVPDFMNPPEIPFLDDAAEPEVFKPKKRGRKKS